VIKYNSFENVQQSLNGHMPLLDALRGIAITMVVFHNVGNTGHKIIEGGIAKLFSLVSDLGWMGVQLFFVLSGFLITGILLEGNKASHRFYNFYIRRILRIFPLYYFFLVIVFLLFPLLSYHPDWLSNAQYHQWSYWCYLFNWISPFMKPINLGHFWSLSVEEQFYICWPIFVILFNRRVVVSICFGLLLFAIAARGALIAFHPDFANEAIYAFTITRWDALAIGAIFAIAMRNPDWFQKLKKAMPIIISLSVIFICLQIIIRHHFAPTEKGLGIFNLSVSSILFGGFIYFSLMLFQLNQPLFHNSILILVLRVIGKYSYAIYIFHFPIKCIVISIFGWDASDVGINGLLLVKVMCFNSLCVFAFALIISIVSWNLIERPFLNLKRYFIA
jgi:peptidoglycan/LPS O-acetylase OafA/YrhL